MLARGASDDKGQVLFHTLGLSAWLETHGATAPPVTIKLLVEGEEESGSVHFAELLQRERDRLACDVIVISDTTMWADDVPSMCTGMRGVIDAQIDVHGPERDLHSGSFGGAVPNPLKVLSDLLSDLHDDDGRVALPGFYDKVIELTAAERELFAKLPFNEKDWLATAGNSGAATGEAGFSTIERIWARPTAEINGMWGGHTGPGGKTIVPREAQAKLSFRLVAHQDPGEVGGPAARVRRRSHSRGVLTSSSRARVPASGRASRRSTPLRSRPGCAPWSGRLVRRSSSPGKAAAARRPTWPTFWAPRWSSSPSAWTRTASTPRTSA